MLTVDAIVLFRELGEENGEVVIRGIEYDRHYPSFPSEAPPFVVFLVIRADTGKHVVSLWLASRGGDEFKVGEIAFEGLGDTMPVIMYRTMPGGVVQSPGIVECQVRDEAGRVLARAFKHFSAVPPPGDAGRAEARG